MWFLTFIVANILGRPTRSALTLSGVAVAVAAVVSLVGIVRGFEKSLLSLYDQRGVDLLVYQAGRVQMTSSVLPENLTEKIGEIPNVAEVSPALLDVLSILDDDLMGVTVQGWRVDSSALKNLKVLDGRAFVDSDAKPVLLGRGLALASNKKVGDKINLLDGVQFEVIGIFESYNVFDNGSLITKLSDLQEILLREQEVTLFTVITDQRSAESLEIMKQQIAALAPGIQVTPARELAEKSSEIKVARAFAWLTSTIAVLIGSIGMLNTMMMAVFERTREIAMLRALGWRRWRIVGLILGEASALCVLGAGLGVLIAVLLVRWLSSFPAAGRLISSNISFDVMAQGFLIAILLGLLGGLYPAWSAARLLPVEGLRHD